MTLLIIYLVSVVLSWFVVRDLVVRDLYIELHDPLRPVEISDLIGCTLAVLLPIVNTAIVFAGCLIFMERNKVNIFSIFSSKNRTLRRIFLKFFLIEDPRKESNET